jgi:hypothetical protein
MARPHSPREGVGLIPVRELLIVPMEFDEAVAYVRRHHRHHKPPNGYKFAVGVARVSDGQIAGVAMAGRPVARLFNDGWTVEILRCATDGTRNACSALYRASARAAFALGYRRVVTYTRADERGASLRGAGWRFVARRPARTWDMPNRPRVDKTEPFERLLWELIA